MPPLSPDLVPPAESKTADLVEPQGDPGFESCMQSAQQSHPGQHFPHSSGTPYAASEPEQILFDRWLRRELSRLYDPILQEPVPDQLQQLLEAASRRDSAAH